jgi:hypothetical protein
MRRRLAWLAGALGLAALWRLLRERRAREAPAAPAADPQGAADPAAELRAKLEQAREVADDRDEYDAAEGQPVDQVEPAAAADAAATVEPAPAPRSLEERRRAIHEKAQEALGEMQHPGE